MKLEHVRHSAPINQDMLADIKELYESLLFQNVQFGCGCNYHACKKCIVDKDNADLLLTIATKYQHADGWQG